MTYGAVLTALADPTRRTVFERLRHRPQAVGDLARSVGITQPAASQHLKVLRSARLVHGRRAGTRRLYEARQEGLIVLRRYLEDLWDDVLAAYAAGSSDDPPRRGPA